MTALAQLATPSTLQKYGYYWQALFKNPRGLLGAAHDGDSTVRPSDAIVFSVLNLTLAVVLQDRVVFSVHQFSPEDVAAKVGVYVAFSLVFWLVAGFAFVKGQAAGWVAALTASSASCAIATLLCGAAYVLAIVLGSVGVGAPFFQVIELMNAIDIVEGRLLSDGKPVVHFGNYVVDNWLVYHGVLILTAVTIGVFTIGRLADAPLRASVIFVALFAVLVSWSYVSRDSSGRWDGIPAAMLTPEGDRDMEDREIGPSDPTAPRIAPN
jgi:hypothetical protein